MLLILAFLNIIVGCLFLYLEMNSYGFKVKVPINAQVSHMPAPMAPMAPMTPAPVHDPRRASSWNPGSRSRQVSFF